MNSCDVPSTLHVKDKFRTKHGIAKQCLVAAVNREIKQKELAEGVPL